MDWAVAKADFQMRATTADAPAGAAAGAPDGPESAAEGVHEQLEESAVASPMQEGADETAAPAAKSKKAKKRQEQPADADAAPAKKQKKDRKAAKTGNEGTAEAVAGMQQPAEQASGLRSEPADDEGTMQAAVIQQLLQVQHVSKSGPSLLQQQAPHSRDALASLPVVWHAKHVSAPSGEHWACAGRRSSRRGRCPSA